MAETLKKLVSNDSFGMLQDKLESWLRDYNVSQAGRPLWGFVLLVLALPREGCKLGIVFFVKKNFFPQNLLG